MSRYMRTPVCQDLRPDYWVKSGSRGGGGGVSGGGKGLRTPPFEK